MKINSVCNILIRLYHQEKSESNTISPNQSTITHTQVKFYSGNYNLRTIKQDINTRIMKQLLILSDHIFN